MVTSKTAKAPASKPAKPATAGTATTEHTPAPATEQKAGVSIAGTDQSAPAIPTDPVTVDTAAEETQPSPAGEPIGALHVAARVNGFRRCGRAWPAAGVTVSKSEFSDEQIEILKREPGLVVTEVAE